jgi:tetratricopeptide (TPR) repeat protein
LGVELTTSYVRNAWWLFGIKSVPTFDDTKKYDLISSYKSLEHIPNPDIELKRYIGALKDDGFLYLGVPVWFEAMKNFGLGHFEIEGYYDPNHINVWSRKHIEGLIRAAGGEIVKENRSMYDSVYLVKKSQADLTESIDLDFDRSHAFLDPAEVEKNLAAIYLASEHLQTGDIDSALSVWPNCPMAWVNKYEGNRRQLHELGFETIQEEFIKPMLAAMPNDPEGRLIAADICLRYEAFDLALDHIDKANALRPNQASVFIKTSECYRMLGKRSKDPAERVKFFTMAREACLLARSFDSSFFNQATSLIMQDNARIPAPFEVEA